MNAALKIIGKAIGAAVAAGALMTVAQAAAARDAGEEERNRALVQKGFDACSIVDERCPSSEHLAQTAA